MARPAGGPTAAERTLAALRLLLRSSHLAGPDDLPALVGAAGAELGADAGVLYLVDYDQVLLVPLLSGEPAGAAAEGASLDAGPGSVEGVGAVGPLVVSGTLAGRAYSDLVQLTSTAGPGLTVWTPLLDGTERLGVLRLDFPHQGEPDQDEPGQDEPGQGEPGQGEPGQGEPGQGEPGQGEPGQGEPGQGELGQELLSGCQDVASLLAEMVATRSLYGDAIERARRRSPMALPAELVWRALPPLTFVSPRVSVAGALAPATQVGGDSFDYALNGDTLHVAILDAMGHGLQAALLATVAVGALRNARRAGLDLAETVCAMDGALAGSFEPGTFVTGIIGELDLVSGWWRWSTCGHAPALLVRSGRVVKQLEAVTDPPLGLGLFEQPQLGTERLQPGDRLLLHTDGVTEARDQAGEFFGTDRLVEFTSRQAAAARPAAETLRRLNHAILDHQDGTLQDDATTVIIEWLGDQAQRVDLPAP